MYFQHGRAHHRYIWAPPKHYQPTRNPWAHLPNHSQTRQQNAVPYHHLPWLLRHRDILIPKQKSGRRAATTYDSRRQPNKRYGERNNTDPEKDQQKETNQFYQSPMYIKGLVETEIKEGKESVNNPYGFTCRTTKAIPAIFYEQQRLPFHYRFIIFNLVKTKQQRTLSVKNFLHTKPT
mmetsp:Transcript_28182/g.34405  ORF Transcript_28182/g.34405 Transcript_28182/m.34405 type:complete len:178 (-) Transcript_28182:453-986(-)